MWTRAICVMMVPAAVLALAACGGGSSHKAKRPAKFHLGAPKILTFSGPKVVSCSKKGQVKTVKYLYQTQFATAVSPEIDGQAPGAQAGYDPNGGHMRFTYVCPGPHKFTITAMNNKNKSASKTVTVEPSSGG
jgi:hypothetical protein